jgi:hypothetical protein
VDRAPAEGGEPPTPAARLHHLKAAHLRIGIDVQLCVSYRTGAVWGRSPDDFCPGDCGAPRTLSVRAPRAARRSRCLRSGRDPRGSRRRPRSGCGNLHPLSLRDAQLAEPGVPGMDRDPRDTFVSESPLARLGHGLVLPQKPDDLPSTNRDFFMSVTQWPDASFLVEISRGRVSCVIALIFCSPSKLWQSASNSAGELLASLPVKKVWSAMAQATSIEPC